MAIVCVLLIGSNHMTIITLHDAQYLDMAIVCVLLIGSNHMTIITLQDACS